MIEENQWITALKALADRSRLRIIRTLLEQPLTVNDLSERLGISQYNVSKHLRILREAGLVEATKMANRREYPCPASIAARPPAEPSWTSGALVFRFDEMKAAPAEKVAA